MAINNNYFEWCNDVTEVRMNYNKETCIKQLKTNLQSLEGIDKQFLQYVLSLDNSKFIHDVRYVPVYRIIAYANHQWTTESTSYGTYTDITTTTDYSQDATYEKYVYRGINTVLDLSLFVGGEKFYSLNLPSDLGYNLWNNTCLFNQAEIKSIAQKLAEDEGKKDAGITKVSTVLLGYETEVFFVPVDSITYTYNNSEYFATFNLHNFRSHYNYELSKEAIRQGKLARLEAKKNTTRSTIITSVAILIYIILFIIDKNNQTFDKPWVDVLFGIGQIINAISALAHLVSLASENDFKNAYGRSYKEGLKLLEDCNDKAKLNIILSIVILILRIIFIIF